MSSPKKQKTVASADVREDDRKQLLVVVASENPVKIEATRLAFESAFPHHKAVFTGVTVDSGVGDQPMGDSETLRGAHNRATAAKKKYPKADYWVGLEGGCEIVKHEAKLFSDDADAIEMTGFAWMVILSETRLGKARTASFFLPKQVAKLVSTGVELGTADDQVFGKSNSKQKNGAVGLLTQDKITRTMYYSTAMTLALIPFLNAELY